MDEDLVEVVVGVHKYTLDRALLLKYPASYFTAALNPRWNTDSDGVGLVLRIEGRNGSLFRYVVTFLEYDCLPRNSYGDCVIGPDVLQALRDEADFYMLQELVDDIDEALRLTPANRAALRLSEAAHQARVSRDVELGNGLGSFEYSSKTNAAQQLQRVLCLSRYQTFEKSMYPYAANLLNGINFRQALDESEGGESELKFNTLSLAKVEPELRRMLSKEPTLCEEYQFELSEVQVRSAERSHTFKGGRRAEGLTHVATVLIFHNDTPNEPKNMLQVHRNGMTSAYSMDGTSMFNCPLNVIPFLADATFDLGPMERGTQTIFVVRVLQAAEVALRFTRHGAVGLYLAQHRFVGVLLGQTYFDEGLTPETLEEADKELYEWAVSQGIPVSLVFVQRTFCEFEEGHCGGGLGHSNINLLDSEHDTRLEVHRGIPAESLFFVESAPSLKGQEVVRDYKYVRHGDVRFEYYYHAAFILGGER